MSEWIIFGIVGALSGVCASLGIGGGFVLLLYFTAFAAMPQREAQLLNLVFFLPIAVVSLVLHIRHRLIVFHAVWPCILGGSPASCSAYGLPLPSATDGFPSCSGDLFC